MEKLQELGNKSSVIDDEDNSIKEFDKKHENFFTQDKYDTKLKKKNLNLIHLTNYLMKKVQNK